MKILILIFLGFLMAQAGFGNRVTAQYGNAIGYYPIEDLLPEDAVSTADEVIVHKRLMQIVANTLREHSPKIAKLIDDISLIHLYKIKATDENRDAVLANLDAQASKLFDSGWEALAEVREGHEETIMYARYIEEDIEGLLLIHIEKKELQCINIAGKIDLENLGRIGGALDIPGLENIDFEDNG